VRSIDKRRIRKTFGRVSAAELTSIDQGFELFLGLNQAQ
jgi:mRNA-degrading endonuclease toxin of MazEF toxin-antitoxin module